MMFVFRRYLHQQQHHHGLRHHHHHHHRLAVVAGRRSFYYCKSYSKPLSSLAVTTTTTTTTTGAAATTTTTTKTTMSSSSSSSSSIRNYFYNNDNDDLTKTRVQPTTTLSLSLSPSSYRQHQHQHQQHQQHQQQQRRWLGSTTTTSSSKSSSSKSSSSTSKNNKNNNNNNKKKKKGQAMKRQTQKQPSTNTTNTNTTTDTTAVSSSSSPSFTVINEGNEETTTTTTTTTPKSMSTTFSSTTRKGGGKQQQHFKLPVTNTLDWESNKKSDLLSSLSTTSDTRLDQTLKASMYDPKIHLPYAPQQWTTSHYEPATDLSDELMERIGVSGKPITVAEYIRNALTHPLYGYYTSQTTLTLTTAQHDDDDNDDNDDWDNDDDDYHNDTQPPKTTSSKIFGRTGDFITAPEISHVFGHCICVWFMTQFDSGILKKPSKLQLVELGPGRGTLMADILQLALMTALDDKKSDFGNSIIQVNLIETSLELREQQQLTIEESLKDLNDVVELEFVNNNNNNNNSSSSNDDDDDDDENKKEGKGEETKSKSKTKSKTTTTSNNNNNNNKQIIKIVWYDDFTEFQHHRNTNVPILLVAQEFFDALPVHVFQMTTNGWREQLIDVVEAEATENNDEEDQDQQENDKNDNATAVSSKNNSSNNNESISKKKKPIPRLRQVLAPDITPAVEVLLSGSEYNNQANFPIDSVVEICPEAICLIKDIAKVLEESHGTALIIDYGEDGTSDTLRAFSKHKQVPLTSMPGQVDVTADVDFFALRKSLPASASADATTNTTTNIINAFGPVTQGEFLMSMGASDMVIHKIEQDETTEEQAQRIYDALQFLVMPEHMGQRYKVLALGRKRDGIFAPPGF